MQIQGWMNKQGISPYNTRLFKDYDKENSFALRFASVECREEINVELFPGTKDKSTIRRVYGDHAPFLSETVHWLTKALAVACNPHQKEMLAHYIRSFTLGSIDAHKEGSRHWIRDRGPVVESYIGFIER